MKIDIKNTLLRIVATFGASSLGVVGAGSIAGVSPISSIIIAGIAGVAHVVQAICVAFLEDGKLTQKEIDNIFKEQYNETDYEDE